MGWESVPWAVTNGQASAEIARTNTYASTQGAEGIVGAGDLKVAAQSPTPGAAVTVATGAALIPCRASQQLYQTYTARMTTQESVGIAATGGSARNDLVVARVEDPWLSGEPWADPPLGQELLGPYIFTRVISGLTAAQVATAESARAYLAAQGFSAIPLAAIILPANTPAVLASHIRDLRGVAQPKTDHQVFTLNPTQSYSLETGSMQDWFGSWQVSVPSWATRATVQLTVGGVRHGRLSTGASGLASGSVRTIIGSLATQATAYNFETSNTDAVSRQTIVSGDAVLVPSAIRGTVQTMKIQGTYSGTVPAVADTGSFAIVTIDWQQVAS